MSACFRRLFRRFEGRFVFFRGDVVSLEAGTLYPSSSVSIPIHRFSFFPSSFQNADIQGRLSTLLHWPVPISCEGQVSRNIAITAALHSSLCAG
jgi:hypothetical protein